MKKCVLILLALALTLSLSADNYTKYIEKYSDIAVKEMERTGVPASITLAQAILESGAGKAPLAQKGNNHFGIKCHKDWTGKTTSYDDETKDECFRVYSDAAASFRDHSDFLRGRDRYKGLFELSPYDYAAWAKGLKAAGYATDPQYAEKLIRIIEDYDLTRFDGKEIITPATPLELETPRIYEPRKYNEQVKISFERERFIQNGVPFIYARQGETYSSIALTYNLFLKELLSFNDMREDCTLEEGTMVYIARKKTQAAKGLLSYVVDKDGETLYRISQRFGVRYSSILQLNIPLIGADLKEGATVRLRKKIN